MAVTSLEQVNQIRRELRQLDLMQSQCPVDRRRAQKEAEEEARKAREVQAQNTEANWRAAIDQRIREWFDYYFGCDEGEQDGERRGIYSEALGQIIAEERRDRRKEIKAAVEEERSAVDKKLKLLLDECVKTVGAALTTMQARDRQRFARRYGEDARRRVAFAAREATGNH